VKQFFLFLTLCCLIGPLSHALDFTGSVVDAKTGLGVNGIMVTVEDSAGRAISRIKTDAFGQYSIPWPSTPTIGGIFKVSIPAACGVPQTIIVSYSGATPIRTDFNVCQGALPYQIQGQVKLKGNNNGRVKLELLSIGTTAGSTDSVATVMHTFNTANGTNGSFSTQLPVIPAGRLILKATLEPGHINYGAYLPTYYSSATSWSTAKPVTNNTFISDTSNIIMVDTVRTVGAGCISGFARSGPNPLSNKIIILLNGGNAAVGFAYTDGSGRFSFNNLGLGTYKIYGDVVPKLNPTLTLTLTATKPCISDLLFEETSTSFSARIGVLAVGSNGSLLDQLTPSPNPVQQSLSIPGAEKIAGSKQLSVRDLSGRIIATQEFNAGENLRLNTAMWPSGMYFLQLRTTIGTQSYRISRL
jgi:hypothetical protein